MKRAILAVALLLTGGIAMAANQSLMISMPYAGKASDVVVSTITDYNAYLDSVKPTTMTVTLTNLQSNGSLYVLTYQDYDKLKEMQYINAFKAILQAPDSLYVSKSTAPASYMDLRMNVINYVIQNDPYDFFNSPWIKSQILADLALSTSTAGGVVK